MRSSDRKKKNVSCAVSRHLRRSFWLQGSCWGHNPEVPRLFRRSIEDLQAMSTLLKFCWAEDVRRIRVSELTYDQAKGTASADE